MTGTADTEAAEFSRSTSLERRAIPTHRPMIRKDHGDVIYKTEDAKFGPSPTTSRSGTARASRSSSAPSRSRSPRSSRRSSTSGASRTTSSTRRHHARRPRSSPRPAARARSRWRPTWRGEASTSSSAATPSAWPAESGRAGRPTPSRAEEGGAPLRASCSEVTGRGRASTGGRRARRAVRARDRAPRVPPHRQPAPGPGRPAGGPRSSPASTSRSRTTSCGSSRRPDRLECMERLKGGGRRPDRGEDGHPGRSRAPRTGRGAQLRASARTS
ncbi:MAG: hypothetical protein KatS3mg014_0791 [Actinomycetota bacterium]|nr:MAG: hypothetical protein KatS3mg014_0791 [Actinomycetota bacterium]